MAGTLFFWTPSLILLRFHSGEAWRVPSYAVVVVPFLLAIPCYFIGKSAAIDPRIRTRVAGSEHVRWSYSLGGIFLATGAVALPVFISLLSGMDEMLSSLCTSMAFVSGTLLPCIFGFIKGMTNSGPFKINRG